jgi:hypothetical protein
MSAVGGGLAKVIFDPPIGAQGRAFPHIRSDTHGQWAGHNIHADLQMSRKGCGFRSDWRVETS